MANITIYLKDGTSNSVQAIDLSYWINQGWNTSKPNTDTGNTDTISTKVA